jgi:hypothetical protein
MKSFVLMFADAERSSDRRLTTEEMQGELESNAVE